MQLPTIIAEMKKYDLFIPILKHYATTSSKSLFVYYSPRVAAHNLQNTIPLIYKTSKMLKPTKREESIT